MSFYEDLNYSHEDKILDALYKSKGFDKIEKITSLDLQKKGIDKKLWYKGNYITVDEKKRRTFYNDFLVETVKNIELNKKGWIYYTEADYIVYWIENLKLIYVIQFKKIQKLFFENDWENTKPIVETMKNKNYRNIILEWKDLKNCYNKYDYNKKEIRV